MLPLVVSSVAIFFSIAATFLLKSLHSVRKGLSSLTVPHIPAFNDKDIQSAPLKDSIVIVVSSFLKGIHYSNPYVSTARRAALLDALVGHVHIYLDKEHDEPLTLAMHKICRHSVAMGELSYHNHSFDSQLQIAKFTWFMIYIDDLAGTMPELLSSFQEKILRGDPQDDPVLHHFTRHLADMYQFWDCLSANSINAATFEFVTGCILETRPEINDMPLQSSAIAWPYFLRAKTGVAQAYSFMIFCKETHPSVASYYQVIPDIALFIDLTNDVLSFYKEEIVGETNNYVHNVSKVNLREPLDILRDTSRDALSAYNRICETLRASGSDEAYAAWQTFVQGYVGFHVTQDRYRLGELEVLSPYTSVDP